ncbi:hypothetical protein [Paenibacillus radicis (ex Xue et al. 2023)]|uniref:Uncharacterized protein n=1 Tax=Paenibacillus radicis (ex Xue et al. 2023) TaxID=2972489 RepID=A0ABT1YMK6_9BACL|nr:hypothetical protein [Paenibacillus radicis (ex Xue et al. 2023)]MCR8634397.1 hypothetical protein [Paenibacillus radicis (ex Xue et al. 2023)]
MTTITIVFIVIASLEWNFLRHHQRKKRTYWLAGCSLLAAYVYIMLVYSVKSFPSPNGWIEFVFGK